MSNPFLRFSNPNPWAGASQKDVEVAKVAIGAIFQAILKDEIGPTKVIADGETEWVNRFLREMRAFRLVDRGNAEILWRGFVAEHARRFPGMTPKQVLDQWHEASPLTADEIRKTFRVDSASSREAREHFYGPDGNPDNFLRQLVDSIPDEELTKVNG